jgi:hypothetical protein
MYGVRPVFEEGFTLKCIIIVKFEQVDGPDTSKVAIALHRGNKKTEVLEKL